MEIFPNGDNLLVRVNFRNTGLVSILSPNGPLMLLDDYLLSADAFKASQAAHGRQASPAVALAWDNALPEIAQRAFRDGVGLDYFNEMIKDLLDLIESFHITTRKVMLSSAPKLWAHQKIGLFDNLDPRSDIDIKKIREIALRYRSNPFIENNYFSWCLLDCMICAEIRMFARVMVSTQFGSAPANPAYFMSKGDPARYKILKPLFFVLGLLANYITPAVLGYYAVEYGHEIIGGLFYAISAVGLCSFIATYRKRQAVRKRNEALLDKVFELYAALDSDKIPDARLSTLLEEANALGARFDRIIPAIAGFNYAQATEGSG